MGISKEQKKAFLNELSKMTGKPVSKTLNTLFFMQSDEEVAANNPQLQQPPTPQADMGMGQSTDAVGNSRMVTPTVGPGGV
jgi:hypothetical protein